MQGTWVQSLIEELDPTFPGATKLPWHHNEISHVLQLRPEAAKQIN